MYTSQRSTKPDTCHIRLALPSQILPALQGLSSDDWLTISAAPAKLKLLLLEDHQSLIDGMLPRLELGYEVTVMHDLKAAQQAIVEQQPDLAVVDLVLDKKLDGLRLMPVLRERGIRFLVFSGTADEWLRRVSLRMGARGFVDKCSGLNVLLEAMAQVQAGRLMFPADMLRELRTDPSRVFPQDIRPAEMRVIEKLFELIQPGEEKIPSIAVLAAAMHLSEGYVSNIFQQLFNRFGLMTRDRETLYKELKRQGFFPGVLTDSFSQIIDLE